MTQIVKNSGRKNWPDDLMTFSSNNNNYLIVKLSFINLTYSIIINFVFYHTIILDAIDKWQLQIIVVASL